MYRWWRRGSLSPTARTGEIQNLAEVVGNIVKAAAGYDLKFRLTVELGVTTKPPAEVVEKVNALLQQVAPGLTMR